MQMIRQYHHGDDGERMGLADLANIIAQQIDLLNEQMAFSISEIDSEKVSGTSNARSTVSHTFISLDVGLVKR